MSARSANPAVFGPYAAERAIEFANSEAVYCARCPQFGRKTELVFGCNAIGQTTTRCPACDGVAPRRKANPNEVLRPQALIGAAQLLPPCPPGVLRCQSCAHPVEGDERLCVKCALPGLSKSERLRIREERLARLEAKRPPAPARERPTMPPSLYSAPRPVAPDALERVVAREERKAAKKQPPRKTAPIAVSAPLPDAERSARSLGRINAKYKDRPCEEPGRGALFTPSGPRSRFCPVHREAHS
jgi:hypothetical protein